jgi:small subunit ribosomal protein S21
MSKSIKGLRVSVKDYEPIDKALRRFKNKVKDNGNLKIVQDKQSYEQPCLVRKREKAAGRARYLKRLKKESSIKK